MLLSDTALSSVSLIAFLNYIQMLACIVSQIHKLFNRQLCRHSKLNLTKTSMLLSMQDTSLICTKHGTSSRSQLELLLSHQSYTCWSSAVAQVSSSSSAFSQSLPPLVQGVTGASSLRTTMRLLTITTSTCNMVLMHCGEWVVPSS